MKIYSDKDNKLIKRRHSLMMYLVVFVFLYSLFALDRIKQVVSLTVDGKSTTNEIWIILIIFIISYIYRTINRDRRSINKYSFYIRICLYILFILIILGGFSVSSVQQYIYAVLVFITPIFLFFITSRLAQEDIKMMFKIFVFTCLIYSVFAIILTTNYAFFMNLVGNSTNDYRYYIQYRPSLMLGSSITVSYYFNFTLPLCFYLFYNSEEKIWRKISIFAIIFNIGATLLLVSRLATLTMIIIVIFSMMFNTKNKRKNITIVLLLIIVGNFVLNNYDLSRLMRGIGKSDSSSNARFAGVKLGLSIFKEHMIIGSGMGRFFQRIYQNKIITVNGVTGIIDPHNAYVLILSEMGLLGIIIIMTIIFILIKSFSNIKRKSLRQAAYLTVISFLIGAVGGSHIINEISYSIILWIYMGLFNSLAVKEIDPV